MATSACLAVITRGSLRGQPATGTDAGYQKHRTAGEEPCEECAAAHRLAMAEWRQENPDYWRKWRARPGNKAKYDDAMRRYQNSEKGRQRRRASYRKHSKAAYERTQRWFAENPGRKRVYDQERRARLASALTIPFTADELAARLSMFGRCWVCGGDWDSVDHVKPLAAGGAHVLANLRPICRPCNSRKHADWNGVGTVMAYGN